MHHVKNYLAHISFLVVGAIAVTVQCVSCSLDG